MATVVRSQWILQTWLRVKIRTGAQPVLRGDYMVFKRLAERKEQGRLLAQYKAEGMRDNVEVYASLRDKYICQVKETVLE